MKKRDIDYFVTVKVDDINIKTEVMEIENDRQEFFNSKTRDWEKTKMKVFLFPKNESILDNLMKRHDRPKNLWKKIATKVMLELGYKTPQLRWSQKAGCDCGCSPGFYSQFKSGKSLYIDFYVKG